MDFKPACPVQWAERFHRRSPSKRDSPMTGHSGRLLISAGVAPTSPARAARSDRSSRSSIAHAGVPARLDRLEASAVG